MPGHTLGARGSDETGSLAGMRLAEKTRHGTNASTETH
jgi:hypothetical protein